MRILHIIPNLAGGGAERFVVDLINEQAKTTNVWLCTLYDLKEGLNDFFLQELSFDVKLVSLGKKLGLDLAIYQQIHRQITEIKPSVVHTHLASINYIVLFRLYCVLFNKKIKFFHTIHSDASFEIKHPLEFFIRTAIYKSNLIQPITISEESQQSFRKLYKHRYDILIYNGRKLTPPSFLYQQVAEEINKYKINNSTKVLANVGRIVEIKNQYFLAQIVNDLIQEGKNIVLIIIGDFSTNEGKLIKSKIESLNNRHIHLIGQKRNVVDYLRVSDAFCLTSIFEGMPISLIEAMSVGCIPICTPVGGIKNMIKNNETGFLAEGVSYQSYKSAMEAFLSSNNYYMKDNLISIFQKKYSISTTAKKYLDLYSSSK